MGVTAPAPVSFNPWTRVRDDLRETRAVAGRLPPGDLRFSARRTRRSLTDPLGMLLEAHERHGPVFTLRILYQPVVFALGPEANHTVLVAQADAFGWRAGAFRDLIPLLGDGLLTIDGAYHRRARRIMLPAFHRERLAAATGAIVAEADRALARWAPGDALDLDHWTRELALRIALRALLGLDPDGSAREVDLAGEWERALAFYGTDYSLQAIHGPHTPWARMRRSREVIAGLLEAEIRRRRAAPEGDGADLLSLLVEARTEEGDGLSDAEIRDQAITLLFAGHDTTTATVGFLLWELARHPEVLARLRAELDEATGGAPPGFAQLAGGLPYLDQVLDETLRLYPPAWVGPRRVLRDVEVAGVPVPRGAHLDYCSYASHRLPGVWERPHAFDPDRFAPERAAAIPKGAYVPFGGGSRTCIGMRFGQLEVKAIVARVLARWELAPPPGHRLRIRQTPTLGPVGGLPMRVRERRA
jgi:cytochrome P450